MASSKTNDRRTAEERHPDLEKQEVHEPREPAPIPLEHTISTQDIATIDHEPSSPSQYGIQNESGNEIKPTQTSTSNNEMYDRISPRKKAVIVTVLSYAAALAPMSSTTIMSAVPEVAETFECDGTIINLSNACYLLFMGLSPMFWGPMGQVYGRRWSSILSALLFTLFSIASALSPTLPSFFIFRILTAFQGTSFLIIGSACIGDIYRPTERGTALSWFLMGTLIGPTLGPLLGGIIVTYYTWRDIFWLQTALAGLGSILVIFFLPETIHYKRSTELAGLSRTEYTRRVASMISPLRVLSLFRYPNLLIAALASSALVWNMYSLLTPIRYTINPRFQLTTPLQSGLFYIAPGCGYITGTFFGGRFADRTVRKWKAKRGRRVPEDRLRSSLVAMGGAIPACMLIYGWALEYEVGGIALPVVVMFLQGVAQLFCFPSLNTYCLDVMQGRSAEVVAGNYVLRYLFGAVGTAVCLPAIRAIGVGWFSSISSFFLIAVTFAVYLTTHYGEKWRQWIEEGKVEEKPRQVEEQPVAVVRDEEEEEEEEEEEAASTRPTSAQMEEEKK